MEIKYFGHASFQLKGKLATVVTDPFDPDMVGLKFAKTEADIVTISHGHPDHNKIDLIGGDPLVLDLPGEFEKNGVRITGIQTYHDKTSGAERGKNTMYKIEIDDVSILHCGDLGHTLSDELLSEIGLVHVLLIPVGGFFTIDANDAMLNIKKIEPSIVIPMHYKVDGMKEQFDKIAPVSDFITKMGITAGETVKKLTVKPEELTEEMKVVIMDSNV